MSPRPPTRVLLAGVLVLGALVGGCEAEPAWVWDLPEGFPEPWVPEDNPMSEGKVELGRHLFYDKRLSGNGSQSCASCHHQELAFSDGLASSIGSTGEVGARNAPSLTNSAYYSTFSWANSALGSIEEFTPNPLFGEFPVELGVHDGNEGAIRDALEADAGYQALWEEAWPSEEVTVSWERIEQALSSFVRSIVTADSPYDRFTYGGDRDALNESEIRGLDLFLSEHTECHHCHGGFHFTLSTVTADSTFVERSFHNTGLYNVDGDGSYPLADQGLFNITGLERDMGAFRAPSLRNVALTAPYMHDGSVETLEEVIDLYSAGGRVIEDGPLAGDGRDNPHKSGFVREFSLSEQDKADLLAFLEALTDESALTDPRFADPEDD